MAKDDRGVDIKGNSLDGMTILLGITGGIAAVDSVRLSRELRRHGAKVKVLMTHSAQQVITPLALKWASAGEVITSWESEMKQLDDVDAILVSPASRNFLASAVHGLMYNPLLMAISAGRARDTPIFCVPSMHEDLAKDPVTDDLVEKIRLQGFEIFWGPHEEGKKKTPGHEEIVARLGYFINSQKTNRKSVVVTLGATRSAIDDVRFIQNLSTGKTGWSVADHLYRNGHDVTVVKGVTEVQDLNYIPLTISAQDPNDMLDELLAIANDDIDAWVHSAAVLDYLVNSPAEGKLASQQGPLNVELQEGKKHIKELSEKCRDACRIGFKFESGIKRADLVHRAVAQIENSNMTAVIANRLEDRGNTEMPRAYLVDKNATHFPLQSQLDLCVAIQTLIERH